jgi:hypothetical protein
MGSGPVAGRADTLRGWTTKSRGGSPSIGSRRVQTLVINYRNQAGGLVNEVLVFDGALVAEGHGTYLVRDAEGASDA